MDDMKSAFDAYFRKLDAFSRRRYGFGPSVSYSEKYDARLLISKPNPDGEVEWQSLALTNSLAWDALEQSLGFTLNSELKSYYSTYLFLTLSGRFGDCRLYFQPIVNEKEISQMIRQQYLDAQRLFANSQVFLLGYAIVSDDDNYFILYDNASGKTFCHEPDSGQQILLSYSLAKTINSMEAVD